MSDEHPLKAVPGGFRLCLGAASAATALACSSPAESVDRPASPAPEPARTVTSLGRLHPGEGVVDLAGPPGERLDALEVAEGDEVESGQLLGRLGPFAQLEAEVAVARAALRDAQLEVKRVRELRPLEVSSLEAEVRALSAEAELRESELERKRSLIDGGVASESDLELEVSRAERARQTLRRAELELEHARLGRALEIPEAEAALASAESRLASVRARLAQYQLVAPISGRVLKILTWPGETVGQEPILRLGETGRMYAVAEVDETDVRQVRVGQRATVTSPALPVAIEGTVERISSIIHRNQVFDLDPTARADTRVMEVRVRLDEAELASRFVHHQVRVAIDVSDAAGGSG